MLIYLAAISSDEDKSKFELIYRQYRNLMYYAANQILHNSSDAEDVVHQACPAVGRDIHWQRSGERNRAYGGK